MNRNCSLSSAVLFLDERASERRSLLTADFSVLKPQGIKAGKVNCFHKSAKDRPRLNRGPFCKNIAFKA